MATTNASTKPCTQAWRDTWPTTWIDIWFKPYSYLHDTWRHSIDNRLLSDTSSSLAWQSSYHYLCDLLKLQADYCDEDNTFIQALLNDLWNKDFQILDMAAFMVTGTFKLADVELEQKRFLVQRSRALSLRRRLFEPVPCLSELDAGLMLVRLLCQCVDSLAWQRIKLFFDKNRVSFIESSVSAIDFSDITRRSIIRACNEIYQLKFARPEALDSDNHYNDVNQQSDLPVMQLA